MLMMPMVIAAMPEGEDQDFMERLYRRNCRLMFAVAWKQFRNRDAVEDVVSDSCVALLRHVDTLRGLGEKQLRAYIVTTVRNTAINRHAADARSERAFEAAAGEADEAAEAPDPALRIALEDELDRVIAAIGRLPPREAQIMRMRYAMELSDAEIASALGIGESTVRSAVHRARRKLKAMLCGMGGEI